MKIIFEKEYLNHAVIPAMGSVSNKSTIPAIEGILFTSKNDGTCDIITYDLEKGFKMTVPCRSDMPGSFILNAGKINQIIKTMPDGEITIEVNDRLVSKIYSGKSEFELNAMDGKEFPDLPELSGDKSFNVSQAVFSSMIKQTQFAIAVNDPRAALNGLYFEIKNSAVKVVSCDGNRLALLNQICESENLNVADGGAGISFIIPSKTVAELLRLIDSKDDDKTVKIMIGRKHVIFAFEKFYFFSRLIEGEYIDYEKVLPKSSKTIVKLDRERFMQGLERASLVTEDRTMGQTKSPVKLNFEDNKVIITTSSITGKVYDEVQAFTEGDGIEIGFNCKYLLDALRSTDVDEIKLSMTTPLMSMTIEPASKDENEEFIFLVLPVKM